MSSPDNPALADRTYLIKYMVLFRSSQLRPTTDVSQDQDLKMGNPEIKADLDIQDPDDQILLVIDKMIKEGMTVNGEIRNVQVQNEKYYKGVQDGVLDNQGSKKPSVNKIYGNIRAVSGILMANNPIPEVRQAKKTDDAQKLSRLVGAKLKEYVGDMKLKGKARKGIVHAQLFRAGVAQWSWDPATGLPCLEIIRPQKLLFPKKYDHKGRIPWVIKPVKITIDEALDVYDGSEDKIKAHLEIKEIDSKNKGTIIQFHEVYTIKYKVVKLGDQVVSKVTNPFWIDISEDDKKAMEKIKKAEKAHIAATKKKGKEPSKRIMNTYGKKLQKILEKNYLKEPRVPFEFLKFDDMGDETFAETDMIQQTIGLQDDINRNKDQISENADFINGSLVGSGDGIPKREFQKIHGKPKERIWIPRGKWGDAIGRMMAPPLPKTVADNMQDSKNEMDSVFNTHSVTRGSAAESTALGTQLVKEGDQSVHAPDVEKIEEWLGRIFEGIMQTVKIFDSKEHDVAILGEDGAEEMVKFSADSIKDGIEIKVRPGSTLKEDKAFKANQIMELFKAQAVDPLTLFEALDIDNPQETLRRLIQFQSNPQLLLEGGKDKAEEEEAANEQASTKRATAELNDILKGKAVAPFEGANQAHIATHQAQLNDEEVKGKLQANPKIFEAFKTHVAAEAQMLQQKTGQGATEQQT